MVVRYRGLDFRFFIRFRRDVGGGDRYGIVLGTIRVESVINAVYGGRLAGVGVFGRVWVFLAFFGYTLFSGTGRVR